MQLDASETRQILAELRELQARHAALTSGSSPALQRLQARLESQLEPHLQRQPEQLTTRTQATVSLPSQPEEDSVMADDIDIAKLVPQYSALTHLIHVSPPFTPVSRPRLLSPLCLDIPPSPFSDAPSPSSTLVELSPEKNVLGKRTSEQAGLSEGIRTSERLAAARAGRNGDGDAGGSTHATAHAAAHAAHAAHAPRTTTRKKMRAEMMALMVKIRECKLAQNLLVTAKGAVSGSVRRLAEQKRRIRWLR
ncbi:hypothetical protein B0H19DRAFT_1062984 [Mycena capillaripes]|nr:hypothetical protein B0H19DRAFT_1062984 [Mycena capillaripes]